MRQKKIESLRASRSPRSFQGYCTYHFLMAIDKPDDTNVGRIALIFQLCLKEQNNESSTELSILWATVKSSHVFNAAQTK